MLLLQLRLLVMMLLRLRLPLLLLAVLPLMCAMHTSRCAACYTCCCMMLW